LSITSVKIFHKTAHFQASVIIILAYQSLLWFCCILELPHSAQHLTEERLKVVQAEFSTLIWTVLYKAQKVHGIIAATFNVENSAQVLSRG
jgi:hypothetical protein